MQRCMQMAGSAQRDGGGARLAHWLVTGTRYRGPRPWEDGVVFSDGSWRRTVGGYSVCVCAARDATKFCN